MRIATPEQLLVLATIRCCALRLEGKAAELAKLTSGLALPDRSFALDFIDTYRLAALEVRAMTPTAAPFVGAEVDHKALALHGRLASRRLESCAVRQRKSSTSAMKAASRPVGQEAAGISRNERRSSTRRRGT
jgi:hypothetical protein